MNAHLPPPWPPRDEPPWVQEVRDMVASINRTSDVIHKNVSRYIRWVKCAVLVVLGAQCFGLLLNYAVVLWTAK